MDTRQKTVGLVAASLATVATVGSVVWLAGRARRGATRVDPKAYRAALPPIPGKVVQKAPGLMYMGTDDTPHLNHIKAFLQDEAAKRQPQARAIRAFAALLSREGTTAALNTYDNQILTWGVGFGGLGLLPSVMSRLSGTEAAQELARGGVRYMGNGEYEVVGDDGKAVRGKAQALKLFRTAADLPRLLVHVARNEKTRDDVTRAMLETFLKFGGAVAAEKEAATQALVNFVAHLQHWAPGYANGTLKEAAAEMPGAPSEERDVALAARVVEKFYQRARQATWVPSWPQMKQYWAHMVKDGLAQAAGHPYGSQVAAPGA